MTDPPIRYGAMAPRPPDGDVDLDLVIPGTGPLEVDIGFGRGLSVFTRAEVAPESRILGIEIKSKWSTKVAERVQKKGLSDRVVIWAADAREVLSRCGPTSSVQRVFVHFPDPWWKKRHTKRRVVGDALLDALAVLMPGGGELYVQTDVASRHAIYRATLEAHPSFEVAEPNLTDNPYGCVSNREVRAKEDGLPVYRMLSRRI